MFCHQTAPQPDTNAVRLSGDVIRFPARPAVVERESERIADLLLAMETNPLAEPVLRTVRGMDRIVRLRVAVAGHVSLLSSHEARVAARAILAEQALPGCALVAARLRDAADACDMASPLPIAAAPAEPSHGFTGRAVLIGFLGLALMVAAVLLSGRA